MSLTDRIDAFYRDHAARTNPELREPVVEPVIEPTVLHRPECRVPEWRRRAMTQGIARDETGRI